MNNRSSKAWYFYTFLTNAPRVGRLGVVLQTVNPPIRTFEQERERLLNLFLSGNVSRELERQFTEWMQSTNVNKRV